LDAVRAGGHEGIKREGLNEEYGQSNNDQSYATDEDRRADLQQNGHLEPGHVEDRRHVYRAGECPADPAHREGHDHEDGDREHHGAHRLHPGEGPDFLFRHESAGRESRYLLLAHISEELKQIREVYMLAGVIKISAHPGVEGLCGRIFVPKPFDETRLVRLEFLRLQRPLNQCDDLLAEDAPDEVVFDVRDGDLDLQESDGTSLRRADL